MAFRQEEKLKRGRKPVNTRDIDSRSARATVIDRSSRATASTSSGHFDGEVGSRST